MVDHNPWGLVAFVLLMLATCFFALFGNGPTVIAAQPDCSEKLGTGPRPGFKSLDEKGCMQISNDDRCPVCAMKVAKHPKFSSAIQLTDGRTYYFCGTGCMIRAWLHLEIFLASRRQDIKLIVVRDHFTGEQFDAFTATWVAGSDVIGPMGPALVPLKDAKLLDVFKKRHGGKAVFRLQEMDDEKWQAITGKSATP